MHAIRNISPYLAKHKLRITLGFIAIATGTGFSVVQPYILRLSVDSLHRHPDVSLLTRYVLLFLGAAALQSLFAFVQRSTISRVSRFVEYDLRNACFVHLQALDQRYFQEMHTGDLMARLTNDLNAVRQFVGMGMISVFSTGIMLSAAAVLMFLIDWHLALVSFAVLPFVSVTMIGVGQAMQKRFRGVQDQFGQLSTSAQENLSGIRVVKAFVQEDREIASFVEANEEYVRRNMGYVILSGIMWPLMFLVMGIALALVLYVGGNDVAHGEITLGQYVQFNAYLGMLTWPMISLGWVVNLYQQGAASMTRVMEVLHREPRIRDTGHTVPMRSLRGRIELRNVGVRHGDRWVFRHVSFLVEPGSTTAVVGLTGAGKSTLMGLIPRVLEADEGEVLIDGVDVRHIPVEFLRRSIGFVPQDTFLFSASLRNNVMFGVATDDDTRLEQAVEVSRLGKDLGQFPAGMRTIVGERGVSLSGGQKQRTALARAVLRDPVILLLDDAMSSVDTHTQAEILTGLRGIMKGRTTLITAMRISTVKDADQIVVIDQGAVAEAGSHRDLFQGDGLYARMYRRELLRQELEVE
ncbi:MAG: ABC transporter ATP-binding protein [Chloroflexota bacterium]|nr:MAG: ABC transporter ATP-binding protein [Chloroflexota bacterium]